MKIEKSRTEKTSAATKAEPLEAAKAQVVGVGPHDDQERSD